MMEVKIASASVDVCGYAKYVSLALDSWWKDKTDLHLPGGECVYPSAEGLITPGGTCSTGAPTCSGSYGGAVYDTVFTNQITGSWAKGQTDLAAASYGAATVYGPLLSKIHEDWYLQADPFGGDLDVLGLNSNPGAAASDEFDDLTYPCTVNKKRIRFKNVGYPVPLMIEVELKTYDRTDGSEIDRNTESVVLSTHDVWSDPIVLEPPSEYTGVVIDLSRVIVPYTV